MTQHFDAIIFDLGGVILNLDYNKTINAFKFLGKQEFDHLYTQSHQDKIFDRFETGEISAAEFRKYLCSFMPDKISDKQIDDAWNAMLLDLPSKRIELLKSLKQHHSIFLYSNTNEIHYKAFQKIIGDSFGNMNMLEELFDKTYYSHLVKMRKPNANGFQKIIDDNNLTPERTLFIDDSVQHIEGARALKLQTIHLENQDILQLFNFSVNDNY